MMIVLKIPLILLLLDLLLRVIDLNNIMHVKNDRQRNNDCGMVSKKCVGLVYKTLWSDKNDASKISSIDTF